MDLYMNDNDTQNLVGRTAIDKLQVLVKRQGTCLFATHLAQLPLNVRPMSTQQVDDHGAFWFFSASTSAKNRDILANTQVQLFYSNPSRAEFLTVFGTCGVVTDKGKIDALWSPLVKAWFPGGKDDPSLTLLRMVPEEAHYWDTKHGSTIAFLKIVAAAVTGTTNDSDGVEGTLRVR
jgi:general stress protein 26